MSPALLALLALASPGSATRLQAHRLRAGQGTSRFYSRCYQAGSEDIPEGRHSSLTFIHIPRTGGSTIEDCTYNQTTNSSKWGQHNPQLHGIKQFGYSYPVYGEPTRKFTPACFKQHWPANLLPEVYRQPGKETFCIVREPYSRVLSQFGFITGRPQFGWSCSKEQLNQWVKEMLPPLREVPMKYDCHLLPQTAFVMGFDLAKRAVDRAQRSCDHMLRYESLDDDFAKLMETKGYPFRMSRHRHVWTLSPKECGFLQVEDFDAESRQLIEEIFKDDFELLGYSKRT